MADYLVDSVTYSLNNWDLMYTQLNLVKKKCKAFEKASLKKVYIKKIMQVILSFSDILSSAGRVKVG